MAFANGFDPNESLQGTWERFAKGQTLVGVNESDDSFNTVQKTGGNKNATLVSHTHNFSLVANNAGVHSHEFDHNVYGRSAYGTGTASAYAGVGDTKLSINANGSHTHSVSGSINNSGASATNGNLQPYITVYYWVRTA